MSNRRWRLVLNGKTLGDQAQDHRPLREVVTALRTCGIALDVRVTWETGDAEREVCEAIAAGTDTIIAAGGDGTLSEVATALAHRDETADVLPSLGLVPMGTGNDFAAAAGIPLDPSAALELVRMQPARAIDLLRLVADDGTHWCVNLASGGFGTAVTVETSDGLKHLLGGLAYVVTGIADLGRIEPIAARIAGPGFQWRGAFIALGLGNGRQAGGGQVLCPEALIADGRLDVTIIPELTGEVGATVATLLTEGRSAALEQVAVRAQLPWVEIQAPQALTLNLDGEPVESLRFRIDCVPGRLRMHLPADCPLLGPAGTVAP